jgi:succinyl-CoA synthetase beta subunit
VNLYEYEAKGIFRDYGIKLLPGSCINNVSQLKELNLSYPVTLKCQVLSGGRGKAGGIKFANSLAEAEQLVPQLLKLTINGCATQSLLVEAKAEIERELYMAVTLDRGQGCPIFIGSLEGGIEIESSTAVLTHPIHYPSHPYMAREFAKKLGFSGRMLTQVADVAGKLYRLFEDLDLDLAEINPLVITKDQNLIALDGKIIVNDDALGRQKYFEGWQEAHLTDLSDREARAKLKGLNLVELDGNIGILCNGAGLTMATMDMVLKAGGKPANFLDVGGGSDADKTLFALEIVHENPATKVILLNILGGITACDLVAGALITFIEKNPDTNLVVRLRGNNQDQAQAMLAKSGLKLIPDVQTAVQEAVTKAKSLQQKTAQAV